MYLYVASMSMSCYDSLRDGRDSAVIIQAHLIEDVVCVCVCVCVNKLEASDVFRENDSPGRWVSLCNLRTFWPTRDSATEANNDHPVRHSAHRIPPEGSPCGPSPLVENATPNLLATRSSVHTSPTASSHHNRA